MRIALIGSRGIPARYSGFETFYEQLAVRLVARGHEVTVYNRSHFIRDVRGEYKGVRLVSLPSIPTKHLDTISHTFLSMLHALWCRYDVVYTCIVGNAPVAWLPRLSGARTLINVDGEDWAREKWSGFARWYQRTCERWAPRLVHCVIADALGIQRRYRESYRAETVFVPYGANVRSDLRTDVLERWGLRSQGYLLFAGRLVPENALGLLLRAFDAVKTDLKLVVVGDAPYSEAYKREVHAQAGDRVVFTGYAFGDDYAQLSSHAYLFVLPSAVEGTRPVLLDQLAFGNAVLVRGTSVNLEVIGECGTCFDPDCPEASLPAVLQELVDDVGRVRELRRLSRRRVETFYNWEWVTQFYEELFVRMGRGEACPSYDAWLVQRNLATATTE